MPKYPDIKVYLTNRDGNAFAMLYLRGVKTPWSWLGKKINGTNS